MQDEPQKPISLTEAQQEAYDAMQNIRSIKGEKHAAVFGFLVCMIKTEFKFLDVIVNQSMLLEHMATDAETAIKTKSLVKVIDEYTKSTTADFQSALGFLDLISDIPFEEINGMYKLALSIVKNSIKANAQAQPPTNFH